MDRDPGRHGDARASRADEAGGGPHDGPGPGDAASPTSPRDSTRGSNRRRSAGPHGRPSQPASTSSSSASTRSPARRLDDALGTLRFVKDCGVKIRGNSNAQQMQVYFGSEVCIEPDRVRGPPPASGTSPLPRHRHRVRDATGCPARRSSEVRDAWLRESVDGGKRVVS